MENKSKLKHRLEFCLGMFKNAVYNKTIRPKQIKDDLTAAIWELELVIRENFNDDE